MQRDMPEIAHVPDSADLSSYLAGQIGQASLDRLAGVAHPELDQHVAAVQDAITATLGSGHPSPSRLLGALVRYASGFVDAATGRGWWPSSAAGQPLDWESMRLAAVCQLVSQMSADPDSPRPDPDLQAAT
jgi:Family of unknown function (DUF6401)